MTHPYKSQPDRAFWANAVARDYDAAAVVGGAAPLMRKGEQVASAGSCFAANIVPHLLRAGIDYVVTERPHPFVAAVHKEGWSYDKFSAAYGNIYTARQLLQLLQRATGLFRPAEDRWHIGGQVIDPFRPGLTFAAETDAEFNALTAQHLAYVREMARRADVFVFTLGLTEAWESTIDGAVFPACPGTIRGSFDPARHRFVNFGAREVAADLTQALALLRLFNPRLRVILTVSPVPLVATATDQHVLAATIYSKSVLRVAAQEVCDAVAGVRYFPAYEIVTGPQAPQDFFTETRRDVSEAAIETVMGALLAHCDLTGAAPAGATGPGGGMRPPAAPPAPAAGGADPGLSRLIAEVECEEAAAGAGR